MALVRSWNRLDAVPPTKIPEADCREGATRFAARYSVNVFNNTLSTLRMIWERADLGHDDNPARKIKRLGVKPKELQLPEPAQFNQIPSPVQTSGASRANHCADFIRFLAFSGCRLNEARLVRWQDVNLETVQIRVHNSTSARISNKPEFRFVPVIPPMRELLERLRQIEPPAAAPVCAIGECENSLTRACRLLKIHRITQHDLRHLFATRCIESGVPIPTVGRGLGPLPAGRWR